MATEFKPSSVSPEFLEIAFDNEDKRIEMMGHILTYLIEVGVTKGDKKDRWDVDIPLESFMNYLKVGTRMSDITSGLNTLNALAEEDNALDEGGKYIAWLEEPSRSPTFRITPEGVLFFAEYARDELRENGAGGEFDMSGKPHTEIEITLGEGTPPSKMLDELLGKDSPQRGG